MASIIGADSIRGEGRGISTSVPADRSTALISALVLPFQTFRIRSTSPFPHPSNAITELGSIEWQRWFQ
jgi:hypothetical protein